MLTSTVTKIFFRIQQFQQYFSYIMAVSFTSGRNQTTRRKSPTCHKSLYHIILYRVRSELSLQDIEI